MFFEQRINNNDIFDVPLIFKTSDLLEIVFNNNDDFKRVVYGFKYSKSEWIKHDLDHFYLMGYCDIVQFGKIKK